MCVSGDATDEQTLDIANCDVNVCTKCQASFLDIDELVSHKKECMKPAMLLINKDNQDKADNQTDMSNMNGFTTQTSNEHDAVNGENVSTGPESDHREHFNNFQNGHDEVDAGDDEDVENQSNFDDLEDDYNKSLDDIEDEENDFDDMKENELGEKRKSGISAAQLSAYMQQLQSLIPGMTANSSSNVMLEPMEATKAAVAQFAENNPEEEKDVGKLHAALYNLQQQQIMQMQLIHQLQQQLVAGGVQNGQQLQTALMNGQLPLGANFPGINLNLPGFSGLPKPDPSSKTSSRRETPSPKLESHSVNEKIKEDSPRATSPCQSGEQSPEPSSITTSAEGAGQVSGSPSAGFTSSASLLMSTTSKAGQVSTTASSPSSTGIIDYSSGSKGELEIFLVGISR